MGWAPLGPLTGWVEGGATQLWGLPWSDATPRGRACLAAVYLGAAVVAGGGALVLPLPLRAASAIAAVACLRWAAQAAQLARLPLYLLDGSPLPLASWTITPGEGIGPFALGPPDASSLRYLQAARAVCWTGRAQASYLLQESGGGWTMVTVQTTAPREASSPPAPEAAVRIVAVQTGCPLHATPQAVRAEQRLADVIAALGVPRAIESSRPGWAELHYAGLVVGARRMVVQCLAVTAPPQAHSAS